MDQIKIESSSTTLSRQSTSSFSHRLRLGSRSWMSTAVGEFRFFSRLSSITYYSMTDLRSASTQKATRRRPNSPRSNHQNPLSAALFRIDLEQESRLLNSSNMPKEGSGWSDRVHGGGILICRSTRTQYICDKTYRSQFGRSDDHERDRATSRNQRSGGHRNVE